MLIPFISSRCVGLHEGASHAALGVSESVHRSTAWCWRVRGIVLCLHIAAMSDTEPEYPTVEHRRTGWATAVLGLNHLGQLG